MKRYLALAFVALGACAQPAVGRTTTTAASADSIDVFVARGDTRICPPDLASTIEFDPGTIQMRSTESRQLDAWAACLNRPQMRQTTVVLTKSVGYGIEPTYLQRAQEVKAALVARGVAADRIYVAGANNTEGQQARTDTGVIEVHVTHASAEALRAR